MGVQCAVWAFVSLICACDANECECAPQDMKRRKKRKEMELLWRGAASFGTDADVFTGNFASGGSLGNDATMPVVQPSTTTPVSDPRS